MPSSEEREQVIKLIIALVVTIAFFFVEIVFGHITKSLSLISDSYNMLSNIMSMIFGLVCIRLATKESKKSTFGWARAEITGALINSVFLVALCFSIFTDSIQRLVQTEEIEHPKTLLIVGSVGLGVNIFGMLLFLKETCSKVKNPQKKEKVEVQKFKVEGDRRNGFIAEPKQIGSQQQQQQQQHERATEQVEVDIDDDDDLDSAWRREKTMKMKTGSQMNIQGVFLHIMGDALGSVVVVVSALVVIYFEGEWRYKVDPALSILMVIIIVGTTLPLIKQTSIVLLQHLPSHMAVPTMLQEMCDKVKDLEGVHEFHVWQLVGSRMIASLHIKSRSLHDYKVVSRRLNKFFHSNGIDSITIQPEFPDFQCGSTEGSPTWKNESRCDESTCSSNNTSLSHLVSTPSIAFPLDTASRHHDYVNDVFFAAGKSKQTTSEGNIFAIRF